MLAQNSQHVGSNMLAPFSHALTANLRYKNKNKNKNKNKIKNININTYLRGAAPHLTDYSRRAPHVFYLAPHTPHSAVTLHFCSFIS